MPSPILQAYLAGKDRKRKLEDYKVKKERDTERYNMDMQQRKLNLQESTKNAKLAEEQRSIAKQKRVDEMLTNFMTSQDPDDKNFTNNLNMTFREVERLVAAEYPGRVLPDPVRAHMKKTYDSATPESVRALQKQMKKTKKGEQMWMTSKDGTYEVQVPFGSGLQKKLHVEGWTYGKQVKKAKEKDQTKTIQSQLKYEGEIFNGKTNTKGQTYGGLEPGAKLSRREFNGMNRVRKELNMPQLVENKTTVEEAQKWWDAGGWMDGKDKDTTEVYTYTEEGSDAPVNATKKEELGGGTSGGPISTGAEIKKGAKTTGSGYKGKIDKKTALALLKEAGGDKDKARKLAKDRGYKF